MIPRFISRSTLALACLMLLAAGIMLYLARTDSAIVDELAHIPAGYGYVRHLDYRLNPEHPPLVKALAALPLPLLTPVFPTENTAWHTEVNSQWAMGGAFLFGGGNDADRLVFFARLAPILLTLLLIFLIYAWAREYMGSSGALLPATLFGLSPHVLAHGHYVTTDIAAACGTVLATWLFLKFLRTPSRRALLYAGLAFGAAQLMKFSLVLLIPYFLMLIAVFYAASVARDWNATAAGMRFKRFGVRGFRYLRSTFAVFLIGYVLVVYPVYFLFTAGYPAEKQLADTTEILRSFGGGPSQAGEWCEPLRCFADIDIWMSGNPVLRPAAHYLLGALMVMQRAAGGNTAYFLGEVSSDGSRLYFPAVYLLKESLPALLFMLGGMLAAAWAMGRGFRNRTQSLLAKFLAYLQRDFALFAMLLFVVFYWAYSIRTPLNIGFRHLFPTLPFIYMLAAEAWRRHLPAGRWKQLLQGVLLVWLALETLIAFPYYLSFFNAAGGGVLGRDAWSGYRHVTDSNFDWGQDFLRFKNFMQDHPEIERIAVDHFGAVNPAYYLGGRQVEWRSAKGDPRGQDIHWLAVSVNVLQNSIQPKAPGFHREPADEYSWLAATRNFDVSKCGYTGCVPEPDYRVGTSIFVYRLP